MGFAGGRVVWTSHDLSRYPVCHILTATVPDPRAVEIPECGEDEETGYGTGEDVGAWAGDGPLLVGNIDWGDPACDPSCPQPSLVRVLPAKLRTLAEGPGVVYVRSVDAGRIVVERADGDVAVLDAAGRELLVVPFEPKEVVWTVLSGHDLVVKKAQSLEVYDVPSGKLRKRWSLTPGSYLFDAHAGIAVLLRGKSVHLLRLSDGRGASFSAPASIESADLEGPGLVYAYNTKPGPKHAHIVFVPFAEVLRRLR
jgi:hypothetical protein